MKRSNRANAAMAALAFANVTALAAAAAHAQQATAAEQPTQAGSGQKAASARSEIPASPPRPGTATAQTQRNAASQPQAQPASAPQITIAAPAERSGYATNAQYHTDTASFGPLGNQSILTTPMSMTAVPQDLLINLQDRTVNDTLRDLPSVELRDQQGYEVSRPQSRGFMGGIAQNTRLDGLNIIGTTAIPTENLSGIQVLNGLAGSLYGPETAAGVFNYVLKRPTDTPLARFIEGYDSNGVFTEEADLGGRTGPDGKVGYRLDFVHGQGESYAPDSNVDRNLFSADLDWHLDDQTVVQTDFSHYETNITGLPGSIVYGSGKSTVLPTAVDPTKLGLGQPGAGADLITDTGLVKVIHQFNDDWSMEVGGLYQNAIRNLYGITNTMTNNAGNYTVTKNFTAVPHFTIGSNTASLNGHFETFGMKNDFTIGTNGFVNQQYSYRNSIVTTLGSSSLSNPMVLPTKAIPNTGGQYQSAALMQQAFIIGDTLHMTKQWAVQAVLSTAYMSASSFSTTDKVTGSNTTFGQLSPTVSVIYTPTPKLTAYATYASSEEEGDQAPAGTLNVNQFMAPYRDTEYEAGIKYAVTDGLLLTLDAFHMTRPLALTNDANIFQVVGTQRNNGIELFAQGNITPDLSIFGGITYLNAKLLGTADPTTNNTWVVGVPNLKSDVTLDYHPAFAHGWAFTTTGHYEGQRAATDTNNSFAPSFATVDLGVRYTTPFMGHQVTGRFQVINVTNVFYYTSIADGNIVGIPGANTAYLGAPRTFEASLEFDF